MRRTTTIATLATICAACAVAAPTAMGKGGNNHFRGPVDQPYIPSVTGYTVEVPQIKMLVTYDGKTPKKLDPGSVQAKGLYGPCLPANGCKVSAVEAPQCFGFETDTAAFLRVRTTVKIKNRRFSHTYRNPEGTPAEVAGNFFILTGRVNKNSITGTIRAHSYRIAEPGTSAERVETCDTGVLTYTASRGAPEPPKP